MNISFKKNAAIFLLVGLVVGCQKKELKDPCDGNVINSSAQMFVGGVVFFDKETGEKLFDTHEELDLSEITVTDAVTHQPYSRFEVGYEKGNKSVLNGSIVFTNISKIEGEHLYNIRLGDVGSVKFAYTIVKKKVTNPSPCGLQYFMDITDVRIEDHPFEIFKHDGKSSTFVQVAL